jgi:hypothetical protein
MASATVRQTILDWFAQNWTYTPVYVLDDFGDVEEVPANNDFPWVGLEFVSPGEIVNSIPANEFLESGLILFHVIIPRAWPSREAITIADNLRIALRAKRLGHVVIESFSPASDDSPPAIGQGATFTGWASVATFQHINHSSENT